MKGSKREKKPGVWEVRVYAGLDPITRRPRQVSRVVRGGARKADDKLRSLIREVEQGKHADTEGTVAFLLEEYVDHLRGHGRSPYTLRTYRHLIDNHVGPALGDIRITDLDRITLDRYYRRKVETLHPKTVRQHHQVICAALNRAVEWGWVTANVASRMAVPAVPAVDPTAPTPEQVHALVAYAAERNATIAVLWFVAATTGCRRGELCALRESAVDLERGLLTVAGSVVDLGGGRMTVKPPKTNRTRRIALDDATVAALRVHLDGRRLELVRMAPDPYVFSGDPAGRRPLRPGAVSEFFIRARNALGLEGVKLHHLRHFMATQSLGLGADIRTVSGRLGHADPSITLKVYSAFLPQRDRELAGMLGELVTATPPARQGE